MVFSGSTGPLRLFIIFQSGVEQDNHLEESAFSPSLIIKNISLKAREFHWFLTLSAYNLEKPDTIVSSVFSLFFSKVQARKAFSSYLQRVQQRLLAESRTDTTPPWPDKDNDQMVRNEYFSDKWTRWEQRMFSYSNM